mmetsp:Transcript_25024/g.80867  ORF Transcript_25024/g.80867 Transcript_25024/m.80867 type:complete len:395 (-) Transcript_25024:187-1371(-)
MRSSADSTSATSAPVPSPWPSPRPKIPASASSASAATASATPAHRLWPPSSARRALPSGVSPCATTASATPARGRWPRPWRPTSCWRPPGDQELDLWGNPISNEGKQAVLTTAKCEVFLELQRTRMALGSAEGTAVNCKMRAILFDWISQVHTGVNAPVALDGAPDPQDMLFRTFSHVDAYLAVRQVQRSELQLTGVACTLAAAGLDGSSSAEDQELATWLAFVTDGACTAEEVRDAAREMHKVLGFKLHQPTAYTFLRRYLRRTGWTEESFSLANYLIELAAIDASFLDFRPQAVAAAAAVLSRQYVPQGISVRHMPRWKTKLLRCAHVDLHSELAPCIAAMARLHAVQHRSANMFVNKKYEWARLHAVAKIPPNPPSDVKYFVQYLRSDAIA